jgi:hypothetical protein
MTGDAGLFLLLAEEFDARPPPPPDVEALLAHARAQARAEACAGCEARGAEARETLAGSCAALAAGLGEALSGLDAALAEAARALAGTMIAAIGAALPGWQARLGPADMAGITTALLASLGETASPRLVVSPGDAAELRRLLPEAITLEPDAAMAPGALRLAWRNGQASRDPAAVWNDIATIIAPALAVGGTTAE